MVDLSIIPLNTEIERHTLEQIAELAGVRFRSKYDRVNILDRQEVSRNDNSRLFSPVGMSDIYGFSGHNFCGCPSIFNYLDETYGDQDVLAVTDLPIIVLGGDTVNGRCATGLRKAIASKYSFQQEPEGFIKKFLIDISLHETGHIHGLKDHLAEMPNGKYCVMATGGLIAKKLGQTEASPDQYELRDNQFCHNCEQYLRNSAP